MELCRKYVVFTFPVLVQKNPFWANLIKKIKIVNLSRNLVTKLIWICGIQWWCSLFLCRLEIPFWPNLVQKIKIISLSWNFLLDLFEYAEFNDDVHYFSFWTEIPETLVLDCLVNLVIKMKSVSLSWNLVPRLMWICRIQWWCSLFLSLNIIISLW